ncbi:MAG: DUF4956 domain-containing protein [Bacteroidetes bacterium]|jgi:hypothetical protein|nr:DUF4956 domain-containing protein [Bacteroidota bacterium]
MINNFEEFLSTSQANIPIIGFIVNLVLAALLALVLRKVYIKFGNSLSNRKDFSRNFLLITMTTVLIITIVKSSLALSLGLVGALSIIRFRAAIKEPEELAYLFLAIAMGLGFGANQTIVTIIAFFVILSIIILAKINSNKYDENQNLHLTISSDNTKELGIEKIVDILKEHCETVDLKRLHETSMILEASFMVEASNFDQLNKAKDSMIKLYSDVKITFLDNKGLL